MSQGNKFVPFDEENSDRFLFSLVATYKVTFSFEKCDDLKPNSKNDVLRNTVFIFCAM